jgi:flagellar motor switch protein FliG
MNDLTKEEQVCLDRVKKPLFTFDDVQKAMDKQAQELGYENHNDFTF